MINKFKPADEWLRQAEYDLETAQAMFDSKRYIYTVFMIHLSIDKALKGIYTQTFKENPPKTHHLLYLIEKIQSKISFDISKTFLAQLGRLIK